MDANTAELTTVLEHDASGRILRFVKTVVTAAAAESMKAKALLRAEELKAATLLKDTDGWLEKAHAPAPSEQKPAPAARPVPQQRTAPRVAPVASHDDDAVVPARDALVPARLVAEAKRKKAQLAAERKKLEAERAELLATAKAFISKRTKEIATYVGTGVGRAFMQKALDAIPADTPPDAKLSVNVKPLEAAMQSTYKQLVEYKYCPTVTTAEFAKTFAEKFWLGVREAAADFESTPRHYPPRQAADAGDATQDASVWPQKYETGRQLS